MTFASYAFDGEDDFLSRAITANADNAKLFTISMWIKRASDESAKVAGSVGGFAIYEGEGDFHEHDAESVEEGDPLATGVWEHWVQVWDTTQADEDSRLRFYKDGLLQTDTGTAPALDAEHQLFVSGDTIYIGGFAVGEENFEGKIAFIDVLDGVAAEPTAFAFSKIGIWTRKPYRGPYGSNGFCLDGSVGFNDASGNENHFTDNGGVALDAEDLPPYGEQVGGGKSDRKPDTGATRRKRRPSKETEAERKARERAEKERREAEAERQRKKRREREKAYQEHLRREYERKQREAAEEAERLRLEAEAAEAARLAEIAALERETAELMAMRIANDDEEALLLLLAA